MGVTKNRSVCKRNLHIVGDSGESVYMRRFNRDSLVFCVK
jgi:hypothetical protein